MKRTKQIEKRISSKLTELNDRVSDIGLSAAGDINADSFLDLSNELFRKAYRKADGTPIKVEVSFNLITLARLEIIILSAREEKSLEYPNEAGEFLDQANRTFMDLIPEGVLVSEVKTTKAKYANVAFYENIGNSIGEVEDTHIPRVFSNDGLSDVLAKLKGLKPGASLIISCIPYLQQRT